jgi:hypothetical protein
MQFNIIINRYMENTITQFNKISFQLLEELSEMTDLPKIKMGKSVLRNMIQTEPEKPIERFILEVLPHKKEILDKNEEYFINYQVESNDEQSFVKELITMKSLWSSLSEENRNIVFQYLIQLCKAGEHYFKLFLENK